MWVVVDKKLKEKKMSLKKLSIVSGVNYETLRSYRYKGYKPTFTNMCKVADALHVSLDELRGDQMSAFNSEQKEEIRAIVREEIKKANTQSMSASEISKIVQEQIKEVLNNVDQKFELQLRFFGGMQMNVLKNKTSAELWQMRKAILVRRIWSHDAGEWHKLADMTNAIVEELNRRK